MTKTDFIRDFAESIARYEGFYATRSRAARNNNPGNLRSWGDTPIAGGFAQFATEALGWRALRAQISKNITRGLTMLEFFEGKKGVYPGYAPVSDGNDPTAYAKFVAKRLRIPVDVPLNSCYE